MEYFYFLRIQLTKTKDAELLSGIETEQLANFYGVILFI
jgi:hypothetical protein